MERGVDPSREEARPGSPTPRRRRGRAKPTLCSANRSPSVSWAKNDDSECGSDTLARARSATRCARWLRSNALAVVALAHVGAEGSALGRARDAVEVARDRSFGFVARERALELLAESAAGPEDERSPHAAERPRGFRRSRRRSRSWTSRMIRTARSSNGSTPSARRTSFSLGSLVVGERLIDALLLEVDLVHARGAARPPLAELVRDPDQPVSSVRSAPRPDGDSVRVEERRLGDVLGVLRAVGERRGRSDRRLGRVSGRAARMPGPCAAAAAVMRTSRGCRRSAVSCGAVLRKRRRRRQRRRRRSGRGGSGGSGGRGGSGGGGGSWTGSGGSRRRGTADGKLRDRRRWSDRPADDCARPAEPSAPAGGRFAGGEPASWPPRRPFERCARRRVSREGAAIARPFGPRCDRL